MKKIYFFIAIVLLMMTGNDAQTQVTGSWILPKNPPDAKINQLNFEPLNYTINIVNPANPLALSNINSAGAYNIAGDLLFYALNEDVYSPILNSSQKYTVGTGYHPNQVMPEIQIIRKPGGEDNSFFIFYYLKGDFGGGGDNSFIGLREVSYYENGSDPYITLGIQSTELGTGQNISGFALSDEINGMRDVYYCKPLQVGLWKASVNQNGFNNNSIQVGPNNFSPPIPEGYFANYNMELKTNQAGNTVVAWNTPTAGGTDKLFVCSYTPQGWTAVAHSLGIGRIVGLEFSPVEDNIIYLSCFTSPNGGGIFKVNYVTGTNLGLLNGSENFNKTFLQTAPNGHIYGVSNDGNYLGKININNGIFTPNEVIIGVSSVFDDNGFAFFVLPENDFRVLEILVDTAYVSCPGECDATATAYPLYGEVSEYTWVWTDLNNNVVSTTNTATNLCEGNYIVCATYGSNYPVSVCDTISVIVDPFLFTHPDDFWEPLPGQYTGEHFKFGKGVRIKNNSTVTLSNCTFEFAKDAKVIIEQDSKLIMNNTTFTSLDACPNMWQGVEVWGNKLKSQYRQDGQYWQGTLIVNNNSVIENAITAVALWNPQDIYYTTMGGIVQATNSTFHNNARSVHAFWYNNSNPITGVVMDNLSYFKNCTFELNNDYLAEYTFYKHIDLDRVKGIKFQGCDFTLSGTNGVNQWNKAIASYNAGFSATAICNSQVLPCTDYDECTFNGFYDAIYAANTGINSNTFQVSRSIFNNNTNGIRMNAVKNATVLFSEFNIGYNAADQGACDGKGSGYGIHMTGCTGFAIEENEFYKAAGAPQGYYTGIHIAETQAADQVYKNTFEGLSYGNYAVGKNWKAGYTWQGLAYYCNENVGNTQDIKVVMNTNNPPRGGVQNPIGSTSLPSGNIFSNNSVYHINNLGEYWFGYYYYAPSPGYINTPYYPANVYRVTREEVVGIQNQCPSNYGGGGSGGGSGREVVMSSAEKAEAEQEFEANLLDYDNVKSLYDNLKDGGNTQATITDIETAWPNNMWELRNDLLAKSPHLSIEVLKATADKIDVFPDYVIFEIMAANPDELKKEELIKYLEDKDNPLPEYMIDILRQVAMGSSYKTVLLRQMAHHGQLKTRAAHNIIRSLLNDTISKNNELRNWLDNIGGKRADEQIIVSYMSEGNYTNALSLANMMPALFNYTGNELAEHSYFMDMLNLQINLEQQQRSIFDLDSLEVTNLLYIAENSHGTAGIQAKGILEYAYGYHFCNCIEADESGLKSGKPFNPASLEKLSGIEITVVPNPAKDWAAFNYTLPGNATSGVIVISDASGKEVNSVPVSGKQGQQIWDTRAVQSGVYFYTLSAGGFSKHGKIVISK
jgi:hypothetical protein